MSDITSAGEGTPVPDPVTTPSGDPPVIPTNTDPNAELKTRVFSAGKAEGQKAVLKALAREHGISVDDYGDRIPFDEVQRQINDAIKAKYTATPAAVPSDNSPEAKSAKREYERLTQEIARKNEELRTIERDSVLSAAISKAKVVDAEDAKTLFLQRYDVKRTEEGVRVYNKDGSLVRTPDFVEATVDQAFEEFLRTKPHLVPANAQATRRMGEESMSPTQASYDARLKAATSPMERGRIAEEIYQEKLKQRQG